MTKYLKIADRLAAELAGSAPGTRVASEPELAQRFAVGRAAARAALQELERRLLVRRVRGAGTFVNSRIDYVISRSHPPSWHACVEASGAIPRTLVRVVERVGLPEAEARWFEREPGSPTYRIVREFYADDILASWSEEWIPADIVPDLDMGLKVVESIEEVLRQMGRLQPVRTWYRVSSEIPPAYVLQELAIEASSPVYRWENHSRDPTSGQALRRSVTWTRADLVHVIVEITEMNSEEEK